MEMKSMKLSKEEVKENTPMAQAKDDMPQYPYGLQIRLGKEELEKLGLSEMPELGSESILHAKVKVTSVSESESLYGEHKSLELQITEMALSSKE